MRLRALLCVPLGHHWAAADDEYETFPVLRCARCSHERKLAPGTAGAERIPQASVLRPRRRPY